MKKFIKILLSLIPVVALGFTAFWFSRPKDVSFEQLKATIPNAQFSKFADVGGIKVHYQEKGEGTPLILIHGFAASTYTWKDVFVPLSEKYRVIAVDLKGFGFTEKPDGDYTRAKQAELVAGLMDNLKIEKAYLVGNSMGGEVALNVALRQPNRVISMVLVDSAGIQSVGRGSLVPAYLQIPYINRGLTALAMLSPSLVRSGLEKSYFDDTKVSDAEVDYYYQPLKTDDGQRATILARQQFNLDSIEPRLDQITTPSLLIWGAEDEIIPLEAGRKMNSAIKGSELKVYEKCGHIPQEEMPERLVSDIENFAK
jgi:pimeloyl-ACP methyl ester carboxylesterase